MRRMALLLAIGAAAAVAGTIACRSERAPKARTTGEVAMATWKGFHVPDPDRIPHELATRPGTPWGDYLGSASCQPCHEEIHAKWRDSFHSRTLYDAAEATLFGDFSGDTIFDDPKHGFRVLPFTRVDPATGRKRFWMRIALREGWSRERIDTYGAGVPDVPEGVFEVLHAFGNRRHQPYVGRWPDGRHWVFPIFWNDVEKAWEYDGFRPYVESCAQCHATGIKHATTPSWPGQERLPWTIPPKYNLPPAEEGWAEGAVGCEVCHGPGRKHVEAVNATGVERYRELLRAGRKEPTIWRGEADLETSTLQCDLCHDFFTESSITWVPGPHGFDRPPGKEPITIATGGLAQFYADGSHKSPCSMGTVYRGSKMFHEGVKCTACHDPHGTRDWADLRLPIENNELCLSCHDREFPDEAAQVRHSRHAAGSPGNRCVECHMPRLMIFTNGVKMMSDRIFKHEFSIPTGIRRPGGPPSSCNICHVDRDDAWTQQALEAWREGKPPPR